MKEYAQTDVPVEFTMHRQRQNAVETSFAKGEQAGLLHQERDFTGSRFNVHFAEEQVVKGTSKGTQLLSSWVSNDSWLQQHFNNSTIQQPKQIAENPFKQTLPATASYCLISAKGKLSHDSCEQSLPKSKHQLGRKSPRVKFNPSDKVHSRKRKGHPVQNKAVRLCENKPFPRVVDHNGNIWVRCY